MAKVSPNASWRDSSREAKFWIFDAFTSLPFILFLFNIQWWTFGLATTVALFFAILSRYGFRFAVFTRYVKSFIAGPVIQSSPWWLK